MSTLPSPTLDQNCSSRITPIPTRFRHAVHTYHGVLPWSKDAARLLYLGFDDPDSEAHIVVQDLQTGQEAVLASTRDFDFHTAAGQRWIFNDQAVIFTARDADGTPCPAIAYLDDPGKVHLQHAMAGRDVREVCADGESVIAASGSTADGGMARVERFHLRTQQHQVLLTSDEVLAALPSELYDGQMSYSFNHSVPNPEQTRLFLKLMRTSPEGKRRFCAFFTYDLETRRVLCWADRISGHPHWMPDGQNILNIIPLQKDGHDRWLVLMDTTTGEISRLGNARVEGPGHPSPSPDGRWLVTDSFSSDGNFSSIYLYDLQMREMRKIAHLNHHFRGGADYTPQLITRGQPHPVWSPQGNQLLANYNYAGERMGLLLINKQHPNEKPQCSKEEV